MQPFLDHVAIRVSGRDEMRDALLRRLEWELIEQTDRFTLLGADADHGKLTLLDAEPGTTPSPARLHSIVLVGRPGTVDAPLQMPEGLSVTFSEGPDDSAALASLPPHALVGVSLRAQDPPIAAAMLEAEHGMAVDLVQPTLAVVRVGDGLDTGTITLSRERWDTGAVPMLDHVGIRIDDAERMRADVERAGLEVVRWVEAPHSRAVFVAGPEGLLIEYVELTRAFAS